MGRASCWLNHKHPKGYVWVDDGEGGGGLWHGGMECASSSHYMQRDREEMGCAGYGGNSALIWVDNNGRRAWHLALSRTRHLPSTPKTRGGGRGVGWNVLTITCCLGSSWTTTTCKQPQSLPVSPTPLSCLCVVRPWSSSIFQVLLFLCCDLQIHTLVTGCQSLCIFGGFIGL